MISYDSLFELVSHIVQQAGLLATQARNPTVSHKHDGSELTAIDLEIESYMRARLNEHFPQDGILGEEFPEKPSQSGRRWIIDPIDGTRSFAAGVPLYTQLMALEVEGQPVLGCCYAPVTQECVIGAVGAGTYLNGMRTHVSLCDDLKAARVITSGYEYWRDHATPSMHQGFQSLVQQTRYTRTWGDAYGYLLLASGRVDIMIDASAYNYWDYVAASVFLPEAGAKMTQFNGMPVGAHTSMLAANPVLHGKACAVLNHV